MDLSKVHMGTDAAGVRRVDRIRQESIPFRQRMLDELGQDQAVVGTHLNTSFNLTTVPAWRGCLVHMYSVAFHQGEPEMERVPVVVGHGARHLRDDNGDLVYEDRPMFAGPPWAQLNVEMKHDGTSWETRMKLYDLRPGRGGEPVFSADLSASSLDELADRVLPAIRVKVADIA